MKRILIIAGDVLPLPQYPTTGAGLRAWSLGKGLMEAGYQVVFAMPELHFKDSKEVERWAHQEPVVKAWKPGNRGQLIRQVRPDILLVCHWPAMPTEKPTVPTVLDLHGPHLMERCFWNKDTVIPGVAEKIKAFNKADYFICAGTRQRYYFFNWLMLAGHELGSSLIDVIPFSLSPHLPQRIAEPKSAADPLIVFGGQFLPWQDPVQALTSLMKAMEHCQKGHLKVFGGPHPLVKDKSGRFENLFNTLKDHSRITVESAIPHGQLINIYLKANLACDLMQANFERELAFTSRTVEYLWCGLPVMYPAHCELAELIKEYEAGWIYDSKHDQSMKQWMIAILNDPDEIVRRGENARTLVAEKLTWRSTLTPLLAYCENPFRANPGECLIEALNSKCIHTKPSPPKVQRSVSFLRKFLNKLPK